MPLLSISDRMVFSEPCTISSLSVCLISAETSSGCLAFSTLAGWLGCCCLGFLRLPETLPPRLFMAFLSPMKQAILSLQMSNLILSGGCSCLGAWD